MISLIDILYNSLLFAPLYILLIYYFLYGKKFYIILLTLNTSFIANKIFYLTGMYDSSVNYVFIDVMIVDAFVYLFFKHWISGGRSRSLKNSYVIKFFIDIIFLILLITYNGTRYYEYSIAMISTLLLVSIVYTIFIVAKIKIEKRLRHIMFYFVFLLYVSHILLFSSYITEYKLINIFSFIMLSFLFISLFFLEKEKTISRINGLYGRLDIVNIFVDILSKVSENPVVGSDNVFIQLKKLNKEILKIITNVFGWTSAAVYLLEDIDGEKYFVYKGSYADFKPLNIHSDTVMSVMRNEQKEHELLTHKFRYTKGEGLFSHFYDKFAENSSLKYIKYDRETQRSLMASLGLTEYTSSIGVVPLEGEGTVFGLIIFQDRKKDISHVEHVDYERISELYSMIIGNILNSIKMYKEHEKNKIVTQELDIAGNIQMSLLPNSVPVVNGVSIDGFMKPARDIGGDYYDFIKIDDNRVAIMIGDISGKGLPAGMLMLVMRTIMHTITKSIYSPKEVISYLSGVISEYLENGKFITFLYMFWDNTKEKLQYASCGHEHIIHYKADSKSVEITKSGGIALGIISDMDQFIDIKEIDFNDGDVIVLYTDGITEARDEKGGFYSLDRLTDKVKRSINTHRGLGDFSLALLKNEIIRDVMEYSKDLDVQYDDMTLVLIERKGELYEKI